MKVIPYTTPDKLLTRIIEESGTNIENEFLFAVYQFIFSSMSITLSKARAAYFKIAEELGFPNHIREHVEQKKFSHDQWTAYISYASITMQYSTIKKIPPPTDWHLRDWIYGIIVRYPITSFLIIPHVILWIVCAFSLFIPYRLKKGKIEQKLSGELLYILRWFTLYTRDPLTAFLSLPMIIIIHLGALIRYGGVKKMVSRYFKDKKDHPIIQHWEPISALIG